MTDLRIDVREAGAWSRRLSITVPADRVKRMRGSVANQIAQNMRMPGFRKGKLPPNFVEQRFGPSIDQETVDRAIQEAYKEALQSQDLTPITQGKVEKVEYNRGADLTFEVEFEVRPEIELARTSGFRVSRPTVETGESDVDAVLERLRDERGTWEALEADARPDYGNQVTVQMSRLDDEGNLIDTEEDEKARTYRFVIGEGQALPDVEQAILTLGLGQEGNFRVRFPEDFADEALRGQEQHLHIQLTEAQRKILPELNDEFAQSVGEFENLEQLRARVLTDLTADTAQRVEDEVRRQLIDQILEANPFQAPDSMVERYLDYMTGHSHEDDQSGKHKHTPEEEERIARVREVLRPQAEWNMKRMMVIERVAEQEGMRATQDEIDVRVEELAAKHNRSPSEVWIQLEKSGQLELLEREITETKVFQHLLAQSTTE